MDDRAVMIKRIKSSYDCIGVDTIEQTGESNDKVDYPTPQERETDIGRVLIYDFKHSFTGWSSNLRLEHTDFLTARRSLVISAAANLDMKMRLTAEINRENGHIEFLFRQRPEVGKILALPPALTAERRKYVFFAVTRKKDWDRVNLEDLYTCMENLRNKLTEIGKTSVSLPIIDPGRGNIKLTDFYSMLATIFFGTDLTIYLHDRYYLTQV